MPKTKVVNDTGSSISLKEGTAGVYRTLCPNLLDGNAYTIKVDPNATYREYWCAVLLDDDKRVVLSSDDCMEYEEVHIKLKEDKTTYTWDAFKRRSHELVKDAGVKEASEEHPDQASSATSGPSPGIIGKVWNKLKELVM
jgi:hypothetical protein